MRAFQTLDKRKGISYYNVIAGVEAEQLIGCLKEPAGKGVD